MENILIESEHLTLPKKIAEKMKGQIVRILETEDGILIKPVKDFIKSARGILSDSKFSTDKYLGNKKIDKEREK